MKKVKNFTRKIAVVATALLLMQGTSALSQSNVHLDLYKSSTTIAKLKIEKLTKEEPVSIALKNEEGMILFTDNSSASEYVKMLEFANVKDGIYILDIAQSKGLIRKSIVKENDALLIKDESHIFHNYIRFQDEDKKLLVKFRNTLEAPVTLRIMDNNGNVIHEISNIEDNDYGAVFNLSKLTRGSYNMSLTSGEFTKNKQLQL